MTFTDQLQAAERRADSMLCVGLDPEPARFPGAWRGDASRIFDFCAAIVDATHDLVCAFKPQIAYFAAHRAEDQLERLMAHIKRVAPTVPVILDAKRGDIGATAAMYAVEAFERYQADALTLSPFMGFDSIEPYFKYEGKGLILLCRTSNPGGSDLQAQRLLGPADGVPGVTDAACLAQPGDRLFEHIARLAAGPWNASGQLGLVVGATFPADVERVRGVAPTLPLLVPGVGAQGGDAAATVRAGWRGSVGPAGLRSSGPIIVNSSRAVLYASAGDDFAAAARAVADATRRTLNAAR
jgi:orotidine-5'-phosphate decarboxylase